MGKSKKYQTFKKFPGVRAYYSNRRTVDGKSDLIFYIRYKDASGKLIEEKVGRLSEGYSAALAAQIRAERLRAIRHGEKVVPLQQKRKEAMTYSQFMRERYLPWSKTNKRQTTYETEWFYFKKWLEPYLGSKALKEIAPLDLERLKRAMKEAGKAPKTIESALGIVRASLNRAKEWGLFEGENPVCKVKIPRRDNRRLRFLNPEEAEALLAECRKRSEQVYEMALLALHCGLRFREIAGLTWQDIDLVRGQIYIRDPKNNTTRAAYMTEAVKKMFAGKKPGEPSDLVFKSRKGGRIKRISKAFDRAVKALGLNDGIEDPRMKVCFHTLRHTFGSWLVMQGVPIYTVKELMGHKTLAMTERYAHLAAEAQKAAVKELEGILKEASTQTTEADVKVVPIQGR